MNTKQILLMIIYCFYASVVYSQQISIKGIVVDATSTNGVEFVTIALSKLDSTVVTGCYTKADGTFEIENIKEGDYIIRASFVGYKPHYKRINLKTSMTIDKILLTEDKTMLKEVTVEGKRPFIQQKIDRHVVNVSDHLLTAGRNGLDVLKHTPGLLVRNREISIMGDNVDVWIDGRPSRMDESTLATYPEGLQGENIEQIEIITNPSSKFDAGGGRSIINIKTKKNRSVDVINGSFNASYELSKKNKSFGGIGYTKNDKLCNNLSFGIRKNMMNDKATVSLSANDVLAGQVTRNITNLNNTHNL